MVELRVDSRAAARVLTFLLIIEALLVALYLTDTLLGHPVRTIHQWFDVNREVSLPTWFSSVQLFAAGILCLLLAGGRPRGSAPSPTLLAVAGALLLFLSADEAAELHERIGELASSSPYVPRFRDDHGVWMSLYGVAAVAVAAWLARPLLRAWRACRTESLIVIAGAASFVTGAIVLEALSYEYLREDTPLLFRLECAAEEWLEMIGVSLVVYALLRLAARPPTGDLAR